MVCNPSLSDHVRSYALNIHIEQDCQRQISFHRPSKRLVDALSDFLDPEDRVQVRAAQVDTSDIFNALGCGVELKKCRDAGANCSVLEIGLRGFLYGCCRGQSNLGFTRLER